MPEQPPLVPKLPLKSASMDAGSQKPPPPTPQPGSSGAVVKYPKRRVCTPRAQIHKLQHQTVEPSVVGRKKTDITESFRTEMEPAKASSKGADDKPDKNHLRSTDIHDARRPTCPNNTERLTFVAPNYGLRKTDIHTVADPPWQLKEEKWHGLRKTDMGRPDPEAYKAEGVGEPWEVWRRCRFVVMRRSRWERPRRLTLSAIALIVAGTGH